jgi:hypothetical protein
MNVPRSVTVALAALLAFACSTPSSKIGRMYASLQEDVASQKSGAAPDPKVQERHEKRADEVREIVTTDPPDSRESKFQAAVLLVESWKQDNLALAEKLGREVGLDGEKLGYRVAAEAVDKQLVARGLPQHYGTQFEWVFVLQAWRLYPIDPATTDADRKAMEVHPLAQLYQDEKKMNGEK